MVKIVNTYSVTCKFIFSCVQFQLNNDSCSESEVKEDDDVGTESAKEKTDGAPGLVPALIFTVGFLQSRIIKKSVSYKIKICCSS